jgi:hypothetical protein
VEGIAIVYAFLWVLEFKDPVESGSNTSTVALRVVGGDEKATRCLEL